ncbi:Transmembrane protein 180 [Seminavis robusta]|uniref:Transmembrane protein 180 n=1 Tax=Seminavis robusta TaxID=568900 RepID=A0A9N8ETW0_9STRA|nr:Transmembrane protein 180 [Seminavis robusta]|eukprot:Sro1672_g290180.1 Transmembrane protein 180 (754) ;mRNA; r:20438-22699
MDHRQRRPNNKYITTTAAISLLELEASSASSTPMTSPHPNNNISTGTPQYERPMVSVMKRSKSSPPAPPRTFPPDTSSTTTSPTTSGSNPQDHQQSVLPQHHPSPPPRRQSPFDATFDTTTSLQHQSSRDYNSDYDNNSYNHRLRNIPKAFTTADLDQHILRGLTLAGVVLCCLDTLFGLFHVDLFLRAYHLPLTTYSFGRIVFSACSTASTLWAVGWLDSQVASRKLDRSDLVGCLGVLLSISFVLLFGRFWNSHYLQLHDKDGNSSLEDDDPQPQSTPTSTFQYFGWQLLDGAHFVFSMTLYDTASTIMTISLASAVSDDHNMTDQERVQNMSSSQAYNLIASVIVATVGVHLFDTTALRTFQCFVMAIAFLSITTFGTAQGIISGQQQQRRNSPASPRKQPQPSEPFWKTLLQSCCKGWTVAIPKEKKTRISHPQQQHNSTTNSNTNTTTNNPINWRQAMQDLWNHSNFRRWIVLEMLLEMQTHFVQTFFKTFVDQLLVDVPHVVSDWSLTLLRPLQQVMTLLFYIPIRWYGYPRVYTVMIAILWGLSSITLLLATPASTAWILCFLVIYAVGSEALRAAGFYLCVSDLVLELKQYHAQQRRVNEPSLAGLLLGAATLICKPMQSLLPILAATLLDLYPYRPQQVLYYLLVLPPFVCSILQLWVWSYFDLHPKRTHELRVELQEFHFYQSQKDQQKLSSSDLNNHLYHHDEVLVSRQDHHHRGAEGASKRRGPAGGSMVDANTGRLTAII